MSDPHLVARVSAISGLYACDVCGGMWHFRHPWSRFHEAGAALASGCCRASITIDTDTIVAEIETGPAPAGPRGKE